METTEKVIVLDKSINAVDFINGRKGSFRAISKCRAGFMVVCDQSKNSSCIDVFRGYKKGALQAIEFKRDDDGPYTVWLTVFAKSGSKIKILDKELAAEITVGDINGDWFNTNLYNQHQYLAVNAKTWADKAFVKNN